MKTVSQIETELGEKRQEQADLKTEHGAITEKLSEMKGGYESAVRSGEAEATLDAMDKEILKLDRKRVRVEILLKQRGEQIEMLLGEREEAHAEQKREKYQADVADALTEAKELEEMVNVLMTRAATHSERLDRMRRYAEGVGVAQIPFRLSNLERRVTTIFNAGHSLHKDYRKPYPEILQSNVEAVERQLSRTPASSAVVAEHDAEQVAAPN